MDDDTPERNDAMLRAVATEADVTDPAQAEDDRLAIEDEQVQDTPPAEHEPGDDAEERPPVDGPVSDDAV